MQYFWNSTGDHYHELEQMLGDVGASQIRDAFEAARSEIFDGSDVPTDWRERRSRMEQYFNTVPFNFDDDMERVAKIRESAACEAATRTFYEQELALVAKTKEWLEANWEEQ